MNNGPKNFKPFPRPWHSLCPSGILLYYFFFRKDIIMFYKMKKIKYIILERTTTINKCQVINVQSVTLLAKLKVPQKLILIQVNVKGLGRVKFTQI